MTTEETNHQKNLIAVVKFRGWSLGGCFFIGMKMSKLDAYGGQVITTTKVARPGHYATRGDPLVKTYRKPCGKKLIKIGCGYYDGDLTDYDVQIIKANQS